MTISKTGLKKKLSVETGPRVRKVITVRVQTGASRKELVNISEAEFKARLTSLPEKGRANQELLELLSDYFGLPPSSLRIIRGQKARIKLVEVQSP